MALLCNTGTEPISINLNPNQLLSEDYSLHITEPKLKLLPNDTLWANIEYHPQHSGLSIASVYAEIEGKAQQICTLEGTALAKTSVVVAGKVIDVSSKNPMETKVLITSLQEGNRVALLNSNAEGMYTYTLPCDLNYSITVQKTGWFASSENIDLSSPQFQDTLWVNLSLQSPEIGQTIKLHNIFFNSGKAQLQESSYTELKRLVQFLNNNPDYTIEVHGHTDDVGSHNFNMELSKERAKAVQQYIQGKGIQASRISIQYFGKEKPLVENTSPLARKKNRRVEVRFSRQGL